MSCTLFNQDELMQRVDGNCELLCKIVTIFSEKYQCFLDQIRAGVENADPSLVMRAAHNLKGMVSNFSANATYQLIEKLEDMGSTGNMTHAQKYLQKLQQHLDDLCSALHEWESERLKNDSADSRF